MVMSEVIEWWKRAERPLSEKEQAAAARRAKAEAAAPTVGAPGSVRYAGLLDVGGARRFDNRGP
jgi:hypothetical protein